MRTRGLHRRRPAVVAAPPEPPAPEPVGCAAPSSALFLDTDGRVLACCASEHTLGYVGPGDRPTLKQVWRSTEAAVQRAALAEGRYDVGCQECEYAIATTGRRAALAHHFDQFSVDGVHEYPVSLDLALSNRCNLQCVMCNGDLSSSIRAKREGRPPLPQIYDERFFEELDEFLPHVRAFNFKGGEPFLARENRRIWDRLIELGTEPQVTVSTNGTLFNPKVEHYLRALRMHAIVSVDAIDPTLLESIRVGVEAPRLWANIDRIQAVTEETGAGMSLTFCIMKQNWEQLPAFLVEADRRGVNLNVIPVFSPREFYLLDLPADDLREVYRRLDEREPAGLGAEAQRVWDVQLERIRAGFEQGVVLRPPPVREAPPVPGVDDPPHLTPTLDPAAEAALLADLVDGPRPAFLVEVDADGIVSAVTGSERLPWLEADRFVGAPVAAITPTIVAHVGPITTVEAGTDPHGADLLVVDVEREGVVTRLWVHHFRSEGSGRVRSVVATQ